MMMCVCGSSGLSLRTHSTPFMPGRLMSINTTFGFSFGMPSRAASALPCSPTHSKPSARLSTRASVPRNCSLSSTMETVMGMSGSAFGQRHGQADNGALLGSRPYRKAAAHILHATAHVAQSVSALPFVHARQAAAVVFDLKREARRLQLEANPGRRGPGMADDVGDGFLERKEDVVPHFGRDGFGGQYGRNVEPVANLCDRKIVLRIFGDVSNERVECVVGRVDGPDDFVEHARGLAGGLGNLLRVDFDLLRHVLVALGHFGQQRNLSHAGAEL